MVETEHDIAPCESRTVLIISFRPGHRTIEILAMDHKVSIAVLLVLVSVIVKAQPGNVQELPPPVEISHRQHRYIYSYVLVYSLTSTEYLS